MLLSAPLLNKTKHIKLFNGSTNRGQNVRTLLLCNNNNKRMFSAFTRTTTKDACFIFMPQTRTLSISPRSLLSRNFGTTTTSNNFNNGTFRISSKLKEAIKENEAVVALESAIISHGMPFPHNIEMALRLEKLIRQKGVIPATVGVIKGQLVVGLSENEIEFLGSPPIKVSSTIQQKQQHTKSNPIVKVSRRDLPYVLSQKLSGGTTVSGTIIGASKANIPIFATGGLGGVHRGVETTFDISADLKELGRNSITVVSAGIKSILDIGKTLEYLETEGVCVAVMKRKPDLDHNIEKPLSSTTSSSLPFPPSTDSSSKPSLSSKNIIDHGNKNVTTKFPSFFTAESQFTAPYMIQNEVQGAQLIHSALEFGLGSGILIAVPIPKEFEASGVKIEKAIELSLEKAKSVGIEGRDLTPFLLGEINKITAGESLEANKRLVENNVLVACNIALELVKLKKQMGKKESNNNNENERNGSHFHNNRDSHRNDKLSPSSSSSGVNSSSFPSTTTGTFVPYVKEKNEQRQKSSTFTSETIIHSSVIAKFIGFNEERVHEEKVTTSSSENISQCDKTTKMEKDNINVKFNEEFQNGLNNSKKDYVDDIYLPSKGSPVVIGGSSLDLVLAVQEDKIVFGASRSS